ncbi:MAG: alpha/beta hydrolase [Rhodospirillaceae bacterium]|nr:alpha/beta hydrolase [Rhodospirillales bacterium]
MSATHPHLAAIAAVARAAGVMPADPLTQTLDQARISARAYQGLWNHPLPHVDRVAVAHTVSPRGTPVALKIFYPDSRRTHVPVLIYFHGGGFALNGVDTHERLMRLLALRSGAAVVGVSYTLAPELRFPGQLDEALAAIAWACAEGARFGLDGDRLAVGGDSAGANLALAATLALRDARAALPCFGLLLYGMFSADLTSPSHRAYGNGGFGLTSSRVDWFWSQYVADHAQRDNPLAAPLWADLQGLPPQLVIAAGLDCLKDDSVGLADRLAEARVPHTLSVYSGVPHSFMQMSTHLPPANAAINEAAAALKRCLNTPLCMAAE